MISLSLSNLIKTILNIQDDNISFPEENYCQIIQKGNYVIKVFKGFLKSNYCSCPHCNSKNIVKNGSRERNIKFKLSYYKVTFFIFNQKFFQKFALFHFGCIINGVDGRNFYQCHFLIKKVETIKFSC